MSTQSNPDTSIDTGEEFFEGADGNKLYMCWSVPAGAKAAVVGVHGIGEYIGRHHHITRAVNDAGYAYYGYDHRGHGKSDGRRTHIRRFDDYLADLNRFLEEVKGRQSAGKIFVWGHSMGGLIAALYAIQYRPTLWGMVVTAPPFKLAVKVPALKIMAARILSNIVPSLALANEVDTKAISRDPDVVKAYEEDENVIGTATVRWGAEFLEAIERANARASEFDLPVLMAGGTGDRVTDYTGGEAFLAKAASKDKTFKSYAGYYHELHNEPEADRVQFLADAVAWLDARSGE